MTARLPPKALVSPPDRMMPRTVNALSPIIVDSVSRSPTRRPFRVGELLRDDDRIGLREKHERIVDDRFVAALEVVLAQAAIAGHVDAEDQDVSLAGEVRRRRRFDDGHGDLHFGYRLDALEHFFGKPGFAGRHLQLGRAGDPIDGALECKEHRLIRGVHRDEHGDAEHDADDREQRTDRVFLQIRPADEAKQSHAGPTRLTSPTILPSRIVIVRWHVCATCSRASR